MTFNNGSAPAAAEASAPPVRALLTALDAVHHAIAILSLPDMRFTFANPAFDAIAPGAAVPGAHLADILPQAAQAGLAGRLVAIAANRQPCRLGELPVPARTGQDLAWTGEALPVPEQETGDCIVLVLRPMAAPARPLEDQGLALHEQTALLEAISNSSPDVIFAKDRLGRMRFANPGTLGLIGKAEAEVIGRTDAQFLDDKDAAAKVMANDRRVMETGIAEEIEETVPLPDGRKKVWLSRKAPYFDEQGHVIGLLGISRDITDRKAAEEDLRVAHRTMSQILDSITDGLAVMDRDWRYTYFSDTGARILRVRREDMIGNRLWDLFPHADQALFGQMYRRAVETGQATHFEEYYPAPLNMWVECHCYPSADGLSVYFRDVTERHQANDALRRSEQRAQEMAQVAQTEQARLQAVLEAVPIGIACADLDGKLIQVNSENRRIWGEHPIAAGVGDYAAWKGWWADGSGRHGEPLGPEDWGLARALKGETSSRDIIDIEPFGMAGQRRTVLLRAAPIRDSGHAMIGAVVAQMDITEQLRAESALRISEEKFRVITDVMPQMVWSGLPDGTTDYFNRQWDAFTGIEEGAMSDARWTALVHPEDRDRRAHTWRGRLRDGVQQDLEYRLLHASGEYRWVLARTLPVRNADGVIIRWLGTLTDIHEQKLTAERLQAESRQKDDFLAMLAHELRNPLAPISAAAHLLRITAHDEQRTRHAGGVIERQARHLTELVNDLLDVSRVKRGLVELEKENIDIKAVVAGAVEQVRPLVESRGHQLAIRLADEQASVVGDRTRLTQVLSNVLNNAAKYTPQGGHIELDVQVCASTVSVTVTDDGSGIAPGLLPHLFDLFSQGERTPDRSQGGLGLGLALVKSIMELHGGQVQAWSAGVGRGASFTLSLPRVEHALTQQEHGRGKESLQAGHSPLSVLIVDDNADARELLAAVLGNAGHSISVHEDADAALACAASGRFDACILDIGLPGKDGYQLCRELKACATLSGATFIALTGYGQEHDKILSRAAGFDHHFVKPVDLDRLSAVLRVPLQAAPLP
jgi:PAS domain S-box-containing protein